MKKRMELWFTLIELVVAMSIFFIMIISTYVPYAYYNKKANLNMAVKDISQSLYSARNMAINWTSDASSNRSIWVYFDTTGENKGKIRFFSYPYNFSWPSIVVEETTDVQIIKTISLPKNIQIDKLGEQNNWLFFFNAISWEAWYYYYNPDKVEFLQDKIKIEVSYKGATGINLKKEIIYNTKTNIVDYN